MNDALVERSHLSVITETLRAKPPLSDILNIRRAKTHTLSHIWNIGGESTLTLSDKWNIEGEAPRTLGDNWDIVGESPFYLGDKYTIGGRGLPISVKNKTLGGAKPLLPTP